MSCLDIEKLESSYKKWTNSDLENIGKLEQQVRLDEEKQYEILWANKSNLCNIYDFIGWAFHKCEHHLLDLVDQKDDRFIYKELSKQDFITSAIKVFERDWNKDLELDKAVRIMMIYESWDFKDYILEYEEAWRYFYLELIY